MMALQSAFVRMLNAATPCHGYTMWYICGKGDWKHKKEWLRERRTWADKHAGICRRCYAGLVGPWHDVVHCAGWYPPDDSAITSAFEEIPLLAFKMYVGRPFSETFFFLWTLDSCIR